MWTFLTILLCVIAVLVAKEHIKKEKAHNKEFNAQLKSKSVVCINTSSECVNANMPHNIKQINSKGNSKAPVPQRNMMVVNSGKYYLPWYEAGEVVPNMTSLD